MPGNLDVLSAQLKQHGLKVLVATTGERALQRVQDKHPDLILLDVVMPDMDGFEVCRQLKANPSAQDIPVLFITMLTDTADKIKGFEAGGVDYITKPFQPQEVGRG